MNYSGINFGLGFGCCQLKKKQGLSSKNPSELSENGIDHSD